ncbi:MAG TPA: SpoIIE family protein phosphatase [Bacteroidia bacterium]|jgi:PAS domain S-box-containing protein|nr:SpoIIE family protein phosphatase [Bacteroidia bacterium]
MITVVIICAVVAVAAIIAAIVFMVSQKKMKSEFDGFSKKINNYQSIIDQANDAMIVIDIVDGRIHQSNPSAAALLGYSQAELAKKSLFDLHPKEYLDKSSSVVADVWEKGGLIYKDIPFVTKKGDLLPVECSAKVAPFAGRPAIVIYARDITERLKLEGEIKIQNEIIEQKNKDITDSINYAKRIQTAILPTEEEMAKVADEYFVFYRPKDIVSGDLYWATTVTTTPASGTQEKFSLIAALDCTGHGVPGAFMSIVGHTILEQTITEPNVNSPAQALDFLNKGVIKTLKQKATDDFSIKDGMDIAMCAIDFGKKKVQFAGANNPMYLIREGKLIEIDGDKQPIGAYLKDPKPFSNHEVNLQKNDCIYIFTDGIPDQFGGPKGKKFKYKQLQELLLKNSSRPMKEQRAELVKEIDAWMNFSKDGKGGYEQTDDMLIIGIRIH